MLGRARCRLMTASAVLLALLAWQASAAAQSEEDEPTKDAESTASKASGTDESPAKGTVAPPTTTFFERLGPETYPGQRRGITDGSLSLEPTFHGLQWPQNTRTGIGVSGYSWIDSGHESIARDKPGLPQYPNSSTFFQQGRGVLRVTPAYVDDGFFVQGQIELVGSLCQASSSVQALNPNLSCVNTGISTTDDLWVRVGRLNKWDVKVGRFQGWEVFHTGMALDPHTLERFGAGMFGVDTGTNPKLEVPTLYALNYLQDRSSDGMSVGYAAAHLYPTDFLRFEILAKLGNDNYKADTATGGSSSSYYGARPTAILDLGWLKLKVGAEYELRTPVTQVLASEDGKKKDSAEKGTRSGVGGSVAIVAAPFVEFGVNAAVGKQENLDQYTMVIGQTSYTTTSLGGFANARVVPGVLIGVGADQTTQKDRFIAPGSTVGDWVRQLQGFGAVQYAMAHQFYVKAVFSYARADFQPSDVQSPIWHNTMLSGRVRLMYLF